MNHQRYQPPGSAIQVSPSPESRLWHKHMHADSNKASKSHFNCSSPDTRRALASSITTDRPCWHGQDDSTGDRDTTCMDNRPVRANGYCYCDCDCQDKGTSSESNEPRAMALGAKPLPMLDYIGYYIAVKRVQRASTSRPCLSVCLTYNIDPGRSCDRSLPPLSPASTIASPLTWLLQIKSISVCSCSAVCQAANGLRSPAAHRSLQLKSIKPKPGPPPVSQTPPKRPKPTGNPLLAVASGRSCGPKQKGRRH